VKGDFGHSAAVATPFDTIADDRSAAAAAAGRTARRVAIALGVLIGKTTRRRRCPAGLQRRMPGGHR